MSGMKKHVEFFNLKLLNPKKSLGKRKMVSQITGGNLTMIQSSIGTPWNFSRKK